MEKKKSLLFSIFWSFFKISPVTFGGGYAMIPLIEKEFVEKRKWIKSEEITDILALSQTIPGSIAVNAATFIGYRLQGALGALAAIIGVSFPTFLIILMLGKVYFTFQSIPMVKGALLGISASIIALMVYAAIKTSLKAIIDKSTLTVMILGIPALFFIHPILAILIGGLIGIIIINLKQKLGYIMKKEKKTLVGKSG